MLTQNSQTVRQNTDIPLNIAEYERYKASVEYQDLLSLTHVLLHVAVSNFMIRKFMVMNVLFGEVANILETYKKEFILTSEYNYPFYYILDQYKSHYRQINWKKNLLNLKYKPDCIIDYSLSINSEAELQQYISFLDISNNPIVISLLDTSLDMDNIISVFADNYYEYKKDYILKARKILDTKITKFNLDNLFIMYPKPKPIKKEDAWNS